MARSATAPRPSPLERWARFAHRRRGTVIAISIVVIALLVGLQRVAGGELVDSFSLPGSESQKGIDLLKERFPAQAGDSADLVFQAEGGIDTPAIRPRIEALLRQVSGLAGVAAVDSPFSQPGFISSDGTIARAVVHWTTRVPEAKSEDVHAFVDAADAAAGDGLRVEAGGNIVQKIERPGFSSESVGLAAAVVILFLAFGSLVAMGLPIVSALFGIGAAVSAVGIASSFIDFPQFATQFIAMIGLGVGIDYCLLVVTRFREGLHHGKDVEESLVLAVTTSGRAVAFAGAVVTIAFLGLYLMGIPFIAALGTATAMVVVLSVVVALTLLPALLSLTGRRVDALRVPFLHTTEGVDPQSLWYRLAKAMQRRPLPWAVAGAAFLVVIALPVFSLEMGFNDAGNKPTSDHTRRAYDLLTEGFGPGFNGPIPVVLDVAHGGEDSVDVVRDAVKAMPHAAAVQPARMNAAKDTVVFTVYTDTKPQAEETKQFVHALRDDVLPKATAATGARPYVAGSVASQIDIGDRIGERMPFLFVGVIGLSFILLMVVFRSVFVPIKAAVMNLLSIGAAYGVVVAIFQWGWGANLVGVEKGPVETFLPMMFFTILFGLSMDYEVFLISRIREIYVQTGDTSRAVADGLAATARVITSAAAIMVAVFLAFVLGDERVIKEVGIGLATAIFIDATVVRLILVPATMELLGKWNWWLPGWLDRFLPEIHIEASNVPESPPPVAGAGAPAGGR